MVLNIWNKFHKVVTKLTGLRPDTIKKVSFNEQRAITPEGMVRYGPLSNMEKTLSY